MNAIERQTKTCERINALRRAAGNPLTHCPTCGHVVSAPYSRLVNGVRVEGCIDAAHVDHLPNGYRTWFYRPAVAELRTRTLRSLERSR